MDLKIKELAQKLNVSYETARKLVNSGAVGSYKVGNSVRIPEEEVKRIRGR